MAFTAVTIRVYTASPVKATGFSGFLSRGLLYNLIRSVDRDYAETLHSSARLSPFSSTPVMIELLRSARIAFRDIPGGSICRVRYTFFEEKLASIFLEALTNGIPLQLSGVEVKPLEVFVEHIDYSKLLRDGKPIKKFKVNFLTPTFFRFSPFRAFDLAPNPKIHLSKAMRERIAKAGRIVPLPEPLLMLRSLTRLWRKFSDSPFNYQEYLLWASLRGVTISGFPSGIRTERIYEHPTTQKFIIGFTGQVNFTIPEDLYVEKWARITDTLLKFACYSNVGGGRTAGFGMIKYHQHNMLRRHSTC